MQARSAVEGAATLAGVGHSTIAVEQYGNLHVIPIAGPESPIGGRRRGKQIKERAMRTSVLKHAVALGFAGALVLSAGAASAAPVLSNTAAVKTVAPNPIAEARWGWRGGWGGWRGGWRGGPWIGAGVGFAAGALIGSAIAGPYGPYYAPYGYGPYDYGYAVPYGYGYGGWYGRCYTNEGYGRRRACDTGP
jgi:hypothetical protein